MAKKIALYKMSLETLSPLRIGNGEEEIQSSNGNAMIPGTSIAGLFRHFISTKLDSIEEENSERDRIKNAIRLIFQEYANQDFFDEETRNQEDDLNIDDTEEKKAFMEDYYVETGIGNMISPIIFYDSYSNEKIENTLLERNHVRIDQRYGVAEHQSLRTEKHIKEGTPFEIRMEVDGRKIKEDYYDLLCILLEEFISRISMGELSIGSNSTFGFGRFRYSSGKSFKKAVFDFSTDVGFEAFIKYDPQKDNASYGNIDFVEYEEADLVNIEFKGMSKEGFIVKGEIETDKDKQTSISYIEDNHYVIPSSEVKGVFRAYATRILNTLEKDTGIVNLIFGGSIAGNSGENKKTKGKACFLDVKIDKSDVREEVYNRIKIDRFTGGVIKGALFSEKLVCVDNKNICMRMKLDKKGLDETTISQAKALFILTLRDIAIGNVTFGSGSNVGHGRIEGGCIKISDGNEIEIMVDGGKIITEYKSELNEMIKSLQLL